MKVLVVIKGQRKRYYPSSASAKDAQTDRMIKKNNLQNIFHASFCMWTEISFKKYFADSTPTSTHGMLK